MGTLGVGLIGVGKHGRRYAHHICNDLPEIKLVALARRDWAKAREAASEFGCRAYTDYRELIVASDVDAVIVVVPPGFHGEILAAAMEARRPVLLEKPAAVSVALGRKILAAAEAAGVPVMAAQTLRYNGVVGAIRDNLASIGRVHAVRLSQRFEPPLVDSRCISAYLFRYEI